MLKYPALLCWLMLLLPTMAGAENHGDRSLDSGKNHGPVPVILLEVQQLPDLNIPVQDIWRFASMVN